MTGLYIALSIIAAIVLAASLAIAAFMPKGDA